MSPTDTLERRGPRAPGIIVIVVVVFVFREGQVAFLGAAMALEQEYKEAEHDHAAEH